MAINAAVSDREAFFVRKKDAIAFQMCRQCQDRRYNARTLAADTRRIAAPTVGEALML